MSTDFDIRMMARALQLARKGRYWASPNPQVGCVMVRDGVVIGEGFTQPAGGIHAEIEAITAAGEVRGATAYVSLEPCSHTGKTGPCADALIAAGISRVVAAMQDPNPEVSGQGLAKLQEAGISTTVGVLEGEARAEIAGFVARMTRGRGRVREKLAMSLDGRTAMASGESQWITGPAARSDVQRLRAESCAIVTGSGTVLADDCALTVRPDQLALDEPGLSRATRRSPLRVLLDSQLRVAPTAKVLAGETPTLVLHAEGFAARQQYPPNVTLDGVAAGSTGLSLDGVMGALADRHCNEILVESGPRLAGALLEARLLDELIVYMAPALLGDRARPLLSLPLDRMADKITLQMADARRVGGDWRFTVIPQYGAD